MKEKQGTVDISTMENDEIYYLGECFELELRTYAEKYRSHFGHLPMYRQIDKALALISSKLREDKRRVE